MTQTKTEAMFELSCPYNNFAQGKQKRYLFVCSAGMLRSATAATLGSQRGYNTRTCGSHYEYALVPISVNLVYWAEKIFFVHPNNYDRALANFFGDLEAQRLIEEKAVVWKIEDDFEYMHPQLVETINKLLP